MERVDDLALLVDLGVLDVDLTDRDLRVSSDAMSSHMSSFRACIGLCKLCPGSKQPPNSVSAANSYLGDNWT